MIENSQLSGDSRDIYLGIMTGTSLDAIDIAACRFFDGTDDGKVGEISSKIELLGFHSIVWPKPLRDILMDIATAKQVEMDLLARTHFLLAYEYSKAVSEILSKLGISANSIRTIGLHGQTVRHLPAPVSIAEGLPLVGATFQIGSGSALAAISGIDVVSDFRSADIALGGQGAPLVPMFDYRFLRSKSVNRLIVNIGGIANVTWLKESALPEDVIAFDCGPGNMLLDAITLRYFDLPFDLNGALAKDGSINRELLAELLSDPYFALNPPKSTGRELFSEKFLAAVHREIAYGTLTPKDALATLTELTARSIAISLDWTDENAHSNTKKQPVEIIVSGGGARNKYLIERLEVNAPFASVTSSEAFSIPVNAKEAMAFAFFAKAYVEDIRIHLPSTTGASHSAILGTMSRALQQR